jgi:hypothetical protein
VIQNCSAAGVYIWPVAKRRVDQAWTDRHGNSRGDSRCCWSRGHRCHIDGTHGGSLCETGDVLAPRVRVTVVKATNLTVDVVATVPAMDGRIREQALLTALGA